MSQKRRHKTLTIKEKCEILDKLENGEKVTNLAKTYMVGKSTVSDIKKNSEKIREFTSTTAESPKKRKTLKSAENPLVEKALYTWFLQNRTVSGEILSEKAKYFYKEIVGNDTFQASKGWLDNFKRRYGIRSIQGEKVTNNNRAVAQFEAEFLKTVNELNLVPAQIYNADESMLFWRIKPDKSIVGKMNENRITFMLCYNVTGTHKFPLVLIGNSQKPICFQNITLPVSYYEQRSALMTREIFINWFNKMFVPEVSNFLKLQGLPTKAILLLDNAPGHPVVKDLISADKNIRAIYTPTNSATFIQPMNQDIIQQIKTKFRKHLLLDIVSSENEISERFHKINLKDSISLLVEAWNSVKPSCLTKSWKKLYPRLSTVNNNDDDDYEEKDSVLLAELVNRICQCQDIQREDVEMWVSGQRESDECHLQYNDSEIVNLIVNHEECGDKSDIEVATPTVSNAEAAECFNKCLIWATENHLPIQNILLLRKLRDKAFGLIMFQEESKDS